MASLTEQVSATFGRAIGQPGETSTIGLVPSSGGVYEATIGDTLVDPQKADGPS